jgi:cytochrome c oxidase subunit II
MNEMMGRLLEIPVAASAHSGEIDRMTILTHWLMAILFVGWGAFFIYTLIRFRSGAHPRANYQGVKSHMASYIEWGVALVELVLIVAFAIPAWAARVDAFPAESEAIVVRIVAEQFQWNVHYPGADGQFGRTDIKLVAADNPIGLDRSDPAAKDDFNSINQLALPVNRPAIIHLSSKDVIHSFSLIQMRVKQDTIPGESVPVWFTPTMTGDWEINCSQLCGLGHYRMRGFYSIKTQADYDAWLKETAAAELGTK